MNIDWQHREELSPNQPAGQYLKYKVNRRAFKQSKKHNTPKK